MSSGFARHVTLGKIYSLASHEHPGAVFGFYFLPALIVKVRTVDGEARIAFDALIPNVKLQT